MFARTTETIYFIYSVKNEHNDEETQRITVKLNGTMTMFELIEEFSKFLRGVGYPLDFGDKLEVIRASEQEQKDLDLDCCGTCTHTEYDIDSIDDDLEEVPK